MEAKYEYASIKIPRDTAQLLKIYCVFKNRKIYEYVGKICERELKEFRKGIKNIRN